MFYAKTFTKMLQKHCKTYLPRDALSTLRGIANLLQ